MMLILGKPKRTDDYYTATNDEAVFLQTESFIPMYKDDDSIYYFKLNRKLKAFLEENGMVY